MTSGDTDNHDETQAAATLIDGLKGPELSIRVTATQGLSKIGAALGPERTRDELLPFLAETIEDDDEVLKALAQVLGDMLDVVGGAKHVASLIPLLEVLAASEERAVREESVRSIKKLAKSSSELLPERKSEVAVSELLPMVTRLADSDWFTSRVSACELVAITCEGFSEENRDALLQTMSIYRKLADDEKATVRREAALHIADLSEQVAAFDPFLVRNEIFQTLRKLSEDDQDSVRFSAIVSSPRVIALLPEGLREEMCLPMIKSMVEDSAWRVRYMMADQLVLISDVLSSKTLRDEILPAFVSFLKDCDSEVRTIAAERTSEVTKRLVNAAKDTSDVDDVVETVVQDILPILKALVTDSCKYVRVALASNVVSLAPEIGEENTNKHLLDMVLTLLKDEDSQVRLNVIASLDSLSFVMGVRNLSSVLLPAIVGLAENRNWRIRLAVIEHIPLLARQLGREVFDDEMHLTSLCLTWLGDCVWSVREASIINLKSLTDLYGEDWAQSTVVPEIIDLFKNSSNYLYRMTSLNAIGSLSEVLSRDIVEGEFLPLVSDLACNDPIPNVRFCAARTLSSLVQYIGEERRKSDIIPVLEKMTSDEEKDIDVVNYAEAALEKLVI
uniref:TOG domain-containing protein n=1 Tax=Rhodosorus marinus TaxID=101924 RepID=A0A7S3ENB3_9RHOD|mmetsp:Transcript_5352/g.22668  ORF Transcript_5352/g.22668 Transcript_5352/m.22668 type:complete len:618 (+) Transcript_5352:379-2232(+)|eukprot:CAMPEP_0113969454 /NCGR_PEP_ID=MMETSP0011_2-20120614/10335_1 /TAXON_ID=101924 /ORGANISM="Rhodosorus marinus" /LENGTH=617 /DNA_ID=CAMNT_0000983131 /DNA_START=321 /DNA_END=2174 /DNA_ORIENTATION=- /assembly_acc=CAM_ASM_000156